MSGQLLHRLLVLAWKKLRIDDTQANIEGRQNRQPGVDKERLGRDNDICLTHSVELIGDFH